MRKLVANAALSLIQPLHIFFFPGVISHT